MQRGNRRHDVTGSTLRKAITIIRSFSVADEKLMAWKRKRCSLEVSSIRGKPKCLAEIGGLGGGEGLKFESRTLYQRNIIGWEARGGERPGKEGEERLTGDSQVVAQPGRGERVSVSPSSQGCADRPGQWRITSAHACMKKSWCGRGTSPGPFS